MAEGEEKVVTGTEKDPGPSSPHDAYNRFLDKREQAEKAKTEEGKKTVAPSEEEVKKGQDGKLKDDGTKSNPWEGLRVVNKEGNDVPFPLSVDGEKIDVSDLNKVGTYAQFGFHHDKKGVELKDFEKKLSDERAALELEKANLKKGMPELERLQQAIEDGRIKIGDKASKEEEKPEDEFDESQYTDPQFAGLVKEFKVVKAERADLQKQIDVLKQIQLGQFFREEKEKIDREMEKHGATYQLANEKEVIDLLAETDESDRPKHTVEEAMKISQENEKGRFKKYTESDPDFHKRSDVEKDKIIQEYVDGLAKKGKPPVSPPTDSASANAKTIIEGEDRSKWKGEKWFAEGNKMLAKKFAQAKKS